jgi:hypothetical protein
MRNNISSVGGKHPIDRRQAITLMVGFVLPKKDCTHSIELNRISLHPDRLGVDEFSDPIAPQLAAVAAILHASEGQTGV